jgi:hypothetical protein
MTAPGAADESGCGAAPTAESVAGASLSVSRDCADAATEIKPIAAAAKTKDRQARRVILHLHKIRLTEALNRCSVA